MSKRVARKAALLFLLQSSEVCQSAQMRPVVPHEIEITTPRLLLRPYQPADWEAVHAFRGDAEALKYEPWGPDSASHVRHSLADPLLARARYALGEHEWAIALRAGGQVIGGCRLILPVPALERWGWATLGYVLQRQFWNRGYAKEAVGALVEHARKQPYVLGVNAICDSENTASLHVLERSGLYNVGMIAETEPVKGRFRDMLKYELVFKRW